MNASVAFVDPAAPHQQGPANPLITIPASAVKDQSVFVVSEGKAVRRHVQIAGTAAQGVRISHGLLGGENLILNAPANLKDGEKVRVEGEHP
jgi:HlyD family secretion protein